MVIFSRQVILVGGLSDNLQWVGDLQQVGIAGDLQQVALVIFSRQVIPSVSG